MGRSARFELSVTTLESGADVQLFLPLELVGHRLLVQSLSEGVSPNINRPMTFTDAHQFQVVPPSMDVPQLARILEFRPFGDTGGRPRRQGGEPRSRVWGHRARLACSFSLGPSERTRERPGGPLFAAAW